jgi:hypothetical protein
MLSVIETVFKKLTYFGSFSSFVLFFLLHLASFTSALGNICCPKRVQTIANSELVKFYSIFFIPLWARSRGSSVGVVTMDLTTEGSVSILCGGEDISPFSNTST